VIAQVFSQKMPYLSFVEELWMHRARLLLVTVIVLALPIAAAAAEGSPGLEMEAEAAYDGHYKYGEWLPIWVSLENSGPDLDAEVQVEVVGSWGGITYANEVSLPTGSRKRVPVYVLPNNYTRAVEVRLLHDGEALLTEQVTVRSHLNTDYLVGIMSADRGALSLIAGAAPAEIGREVTLIDLALTDLPGRSAGLQSLDCLILNDVDSLILSPEQRSALDMWVRNGGHLVIGGGSSAQNTVAGLPESLVPFEPRGQRDLDSVGALEQFSGEPIRVGGPFVLSVGDPVRGEALATQGREVLIQELALGSGRVSFVALDLAASPFDAWSGTLGFWQRLVFADAYYPQGLPPDVSQRQMRASQMGYAVSNLPSLDLPSVKWLAVVLGAYVILVGPVNYLLLRWRRALQWAWVTIPAITVVFSAGAFGLGYAMRGTDLIVNKIAIVAMQPDGTSYANTYVGLFSPSQQSYEIEVDGDGLVSPLNSEVSPFSSVSPGTGGGMVFVQGKPSRVRGLTVNQWSMQTFVYESTWANAGRVVADLWTEDDGLAGTVRNETPFSLDDAVVVLGMDFVRVGDLEPGEEVDVRFQLDEVSSAFGPPLGYRLFEQDFREAGPSGPPREAQLKQTILDSLTTTTMKPGVSGPNGSFDQLMFLAWFSSAPPRISVRGRQPTEQVTALVYAPLTYRVRDAERVSMRPGLIPGRVVQMPSEGGPCGAGGMTAVYVGRGDAVFEYRFPEGVQDLQVESLSVALGSDGGWARAPDTALYDWQRGEWVAIVDPVVGTNVVDATQGLVSDQGLVRVRISSDAGQGGCFYVQVGMEGTR
jgi:hypothetical protein